LAIFCWALGGGFCPFVHSSYFAWAHEPTVGAPPATAVAGAAPDCAGEAVSDAVASHDAHEKTLRKTTGVTGKLRRSQFLIERSYPTRETGEQSMRQSFSDY
jgi:hypothetical protein